MSFDSVTEKIAHFIGTFDLTIEQTRLRDQYEEFSAMRRKAELEELEDPINFKVKADLELDPGKYGQLSYLFETPPATSELTPAPEGPAPLNGATLAPPPESDLPLPEAVAAGAATQFVIILEPQIVTELIGSAITYTFQSIYMRDNDVVGEGDFRDTEQLMAMAEAAFEVATSLHVFSGLSFSISDYLSVEYVEAMADDMLDPVYAEVEGAVVYQFHGEDAMGVIVNGEYVDEAPVWEDLLPAYHQPEDEEESEESYFDPYPVEWDRDTDPEYSDGHEVIVGGNLAINAVSATVAWVDAPYIAVGGKSIELTMVSQVAVVSDMDEGTKGDSGTKVVQSSTIEVEGSAADWISEGGEDAPGLVHVDWIHGDLIVANFVKQTIDATDIDHIETEVSASTTLYAMGDNEMVDVTNILQLGSYYDLVMIDGDMISVDAFVQTLVLMDDDIVTGGLPEPVDGKDENLVMNEVSLLTEGEDTHQEMEASMADAMAMQQSDMEALEDALMNDPMFAGMEQMRVLKVDGSLVQLNVVEQSTLLADQDDVHLHGPKADETEVIAGSNALLNAASVTKAGVDSVVMAQDGSYSDLLLHQASLIDMPTNEDITEMTNDAIAALMDEVGMPDHANGIGPAGNDLTPSEMATASDGLQTMLA